MPMVFDTTIINGHRYSWASVSVRINGVDYLGLRSIFYSTSLTPGVIHGVDPHKVGRTPGQVEHTCDFEVYRREWNRIVKTLGQSFGRVPFDVQVQYAESLDEGVTTDKIIGCRIASVEFANEEGPDPTIVKVVCDPMDILIGAEELSIDALVDRGVVLLGASEEG